MGQRALPSPVPGAGDGSPAVFLSLRRMVAADIHASAVGVCTTHPSASSTVDLPDLFPANLMKFPQTLFLSPPSRRSTTHSHCCCLLLFRSPTLSLLVSSSLHSAHSTRSPIVLCLSHPIGPFLGHPSFFSPSLASPFCFRHRTCQKRPDHRCIPQQPLFLTRQLEQHAATNQGGRASKPSATRTTMPLSHNDQYVVNAAQPSRRQIIEFKLSEEALEEILNGNESIQLDMNQAVS